MYSGLDSVNFDGVWALGWNNHQLGIDTEPEVGKADYYKMKDVRVPTKLTKFPFEFQKIRILTCGGSHTLMVTDENKIYTWGRNQKYVGWCKHDDCTNLTPYFSAVNTIVDNWVMVIL